MYEFASHDAGQRDELFLERLDTFMDKCLADIRTFAERELRPYEETRRYIAQWHAKYLFQPSSSSEPSASDEKCARVRSVLCDTSRVLESLSETSGVQSFLLAVDPHDPNDGGFLGGSVVGREFWRGMRSGGENGAKAFRSQCLKRRQQPQNTGDDFRGPNTSVTPPPAKHGDARSLKLELYEEVRKALRSVSGIRNSEMKWTNHERLDIYGVQLVGWPQGIPVQNPSTLKVSQNKQLLEALQDGSLRFEKTMITGREDTPIASSSQGPNIVPTSETDDAGEDFSWAYDSDGGASPPPSQSQPPPPATPSEPPHSAGSSTPHSWTAVTEMARSLGVNLKDVRPAKRQRSQEPDNSPDRPQS